MEKSINIPFHSAFSPEGDLNPCPAVTTLNFSRSQVKVIIGSRGKNAANVSNVYSLVNGQGKSGEKYGTQSKDTVTLLPRIQGVYQ